MKSIEVNLGNKRMSENEFAREVTLRAGAPLQWLDALREIRRRLLGQHPRHSVCPGSGKGAG